MNLNEMFEMLKEINETWAEIGRQNREIMDISEGITAMCEKMCESVVVNGNE